MIITDLTIKNFRNIAEMRFQPGENVNVIYGENAQGKTNIIEALYLFTGMRSFRARNTCELIMWGKSTSELTADFFAAGREQNARMVIDTKRTGYLNGIKLPSVSKFDGEFPAVIFTPDHLSIVKGAPDERRKFLDTVLCGISEAYDNLLSSYYHILRQRNAVLKAHKNMKPELCFIDEWDAQLAAAGAKIDFQREQLIAHLLPYAREYYEGLSTAGEEFEIRLEHSYAPNVSELSFDDGKKEGERTRTDLLYGSMRLALLNAKSADMGACVTSCGAHRNDMSIFFDGKSAKIWGSQGQQRSCAIALKLAEARVIEEKTGEKPVILLDDIMSELDERRQSFIMNNIKNWQVFITCCDPSSILRLRDGKKFEIREGRII